MINIAVVKLRKAMFSSKRMLLLLTKHTYDMKCELKFYKSHGLLHTVSGLRDFLFKLILNQQRRQARMIYSIRGKK